MSNNIETKIHVFTDDTLKKHDLKVAKEVADMVSKASVISTARKLIKMNSGQQLQAMTNDCESLQLEEEKKDKMVNYILDNILE